MSEINFYKLLNPWKIPVTQVFEASYFTKVPESWLIIIADVKNSSSAVTAGRHNDVNLVAAGSLIVGLNIARDYNIDIPFFFGGDGGTMLVPSEILSAVIAGLHAHNQNSIQNFELEMHIGSISVKEIIEAGHDVKIAKVQFGKDFNKAIVLGDGLQYAESLIKKPGVQNAGEGELAELNLTGLECRWNRVKPPSEENEIVCYLIEAIDPLHQIEVYRNVLTKIDEIYGSIETRNPLSADRLKLLLTFDKIKKELLTKYGKLKLNNFMKNFVNTFIGRLYFRYNWKVNNLRGKEYLRQIISNADTLTIDGRINTIITGKMDKRIQFIKYLSAKEKEGELIFGHHISKESVMTCYIENRNSKHIHFVDGADGGYTEASKEFKNKQSQLINRTDG
jgi:hypothetical protein